MSDSERFRKLQSAIEGLSSTEATSWALIVAGMKHVAGLVETGRLDESRRAEEGDRIVERLSACLQAHIDEIDREGKERNQGAGN